MARWAFLLLWCCQVAAAEPALKVGVLSNWGHQFAQQRWQPMMAYLSERVEGASFEVYPGTFDELNQAMDAGQISFIITNPGQYLYLSKRYPLSWLATMRSRRHNGTTYAIGSAILVRADSPYRNIYDLEDKRIAASGAHALGGYRAAIGLLKKRGIARPEQFFGQTHFLGFPLDPLVYQVRDRNVDAAITPFCTLEDMVARGLVRAEEFRVLNRSQPDGYDCQVSTQLYPNWSFAASADVGTELTEPLTRALLALQADHPAAIQAGTSGWTAPISQLQVITLFSELELDQAVSGQNPSLWQWLAINRHLGLGGVLLFLLATLYHFWIEYKVRRQSEELIESERQLKQKAVQLEKLHSTAIIGEVGSGLAHELNQPLAAISNYCEGGMVRLATMPVADPDLQQVLEKISQQAERAGNVVARIRGLLKRQETVVGKTNILTVVDDSLLLLKVELERRGIEVRRQLKGEPYFVLADKVAMQQVLVNLLKNAIDALEDRLGSRIDISLHFAERSLSLTVCDNGPGFAQEAEIMMASFITTKPDGLGLGLAICRDLVEQQQGEFKICNGRAQGACVLISLPRFHGQPGGE